MGTTLTNLIYHLVFSTKHRAPLIGPDLQIDLYAYIGGTIRGEGGVLLTAGGMPDHVHLLAKFKPDIAVSKMLEKIKGHSSKWINEQGRPRGRFEWQGGYGAFTVSQQISTVQNYIASQAEHHRTTSFQDELLALLRRHGIEFDPEHLWD